MIKNRHSYICEVLSMKGAAMHIEVDDYLDGLNITVGYDSQQHGGDESL